LSTQASRRSGNVDQGLSDLAEPLLAERQLGADHLAPRDARRDLDREAERARLAGGDGERRLARGDRPSRRRDQAGAGAGLLGPVVVDAQLEGEPVSRPSRIPAR